MLRHAHRFIALLEAAQALREAHALAWLGHRPACWFIESTKLLGHAKSEIHALVYATHGVCAERANPSFLQASAEVEVALALRELAWSVTVETSSSSPEVKSANDAFSESVHHVVGACSPLIIVVSPVVALELLLEALDVLHLVLTLALHVLKLLSRIVLC